MQEFVHAFGSTGKSVVRNSKSELNMKIFDWKKRKDFEKYEIPEGTAHHISEEALIFLTFVDIALIRLRPIRKHNISHSWFEEVILKGG